MQDTIREEIFNTKTIAQKLESLGFTIFTADATNRFEAYEKIGIADFLSLDLNF